MASATNPLHNQAPTRTMENLHLKEPVQRAGRPFGGDHPVLIMIHGRGATAESILELAPLLAVEDFTLLAPQAANNTWYPQSFLAPDAQNAPWAGWALDRLATLVAEVESAGTPSRRIALLGFSQGACLTLEFAARHARRYGALIGFSGGLIGPPGTPRAYVGGFDDTPVFLGCSDVDAHIPLARVDETAQVLRRMGAVVDERIYPAMGHTVNDDEIAAASGLLAAI
jgi:predicted esterase